mmetsp:Transcript_4009/g.12035  ORF Transcript_4009/g.12035 Transcript_4009/m.12035 type:complete len:217 (-) Transcript_4009:803-1453(-)
MSSLVRPHVKVGQKFRQQRLRKLDNVLVVVRQHLLELLLLDLCDRLDKVLLVLCHIEECPALAWGGKLPNLRLRRHALNKDSVRDAKALAYLLVEHWGMVAPRRVGCRGMVLRWHGCTQFEDDVHVVVCAGKLGRTLLRAEQLARVSQADLERQHDAPARMSLVHYNAVLYLLLLSLLVELLAHSLNHPLGEDSVQLFKPVVLFSFIWRLWDLHWP